VFSVSVLSDYIKKQLAKGHSLEKIRAKLLEAGHSKKVVDEEIAKSGRKNERIAGAKNDRLRKMLLYYAPAAAIVILIIISLMQMPSKAKACETAADSDYCYAKVAMEENNANICEKIVNADAKAPCEQKLWLVNDCAYMEMTGFSQAEIEECQRKAFVNSLRS
jgi:hypothetical protein